MQVVLNAIISRAEQSTKYPDTCYFDIVDLETGKPMQAGTRVLSSEQIVPHLLQPVRIMGKVTVQPSRAGGHNVQFNELSIQGVGRPGESPANKG